MHLDDDDPKVAEPAPAGAPAEDQDAEQQAPEGEEPEGEDAEKKAPTDDEDLGDDEQDDKEGDDEDDDGEDEPKRKTSRAQRYRRQAERLKAENEALRSRTGGSLPPDQASLARAMEYRVWQEIGDPPDPNDAKYQNNYVRFERETQAWLSSQRAVTREVRKEFAGTIQREQERVGELVATHKERVARLRTKVPDFDAIMARATVPVAPHVERLILESKRSDRISLYLAKDQSKLVKLNNLSSEAVARELGRIEGRLSSLPQSKQQTKARPPIKPLRGGGTSPPSGLAAVNAYIKKQYGN